MKDVETFRRIIDGVEETVYDPANRQQKSWAELAKGFSVHVLWNLGTYHQSLVRNPLMQHLAHKVERHNSTL